MQALIDGLRLTPDLRACICNVEMPPEELLDRQLARLSGIDATTIRYRRCNASHADRLQSAFDTLESVVERFSFVGRPFNLENIAATADAVHADLLLLDYIQRIPPPGEYGDRRGSVDATMNYLRQFADAGMAVIVVAAVSRTKDRRGRSSYASEGLNLASFRESSELEFGADSAFILAPMDEPEDEVILRSLKARYAEAKDMVLHFDRAHQRFQPASGPAVNGGGLSEALNSLWAGTLPADDDDCGGDD